MSSERRKAPRVAFERGLNTVIIAIDGTWRRAATLDDISETGAKITVEQSIQGLNLREFFLLLSATGLAYRRCELVRVNGDEIGLRFLTTKDSPKSSKQAKSAARA